MDFLQNSFIGKIIITLFWSMVPVVELRGAIPIGVGLDLPLWVAIAVSVIGNMIPVPFIILFIRQIFKWMRKVNSTFARIVDKMEEKANKHRDKVTKYGFWGLFILVAIPLPGTGAWTGALVAAVMELRFKTALPAIFAGVIAAAVIVSIVTYGVAAFLVF
ncbi:MAG: small multi-drug export protein [Clostridia bacterium]|nr:small multi-drug export protein [Clostridia bacterium]